MNQLICTQCFKNYGLRTLAEELAKNEEYINCKNCGNKGLKIEKNAADELMSSFFVYGSIPPEIGGPAPVYQYNDYQYPGEVNFATELDEDLKLLSEYLKVGLFHYGPPMWRVGATEYYNMLSIDKVEGEDRKKIWKDIISRCEDNYLEEDSKIFRIRTGEKLPPALPEEFDSPPREFVKEGRFHTKDFPLFYGALDIETCLHETRVTLADYTMLAVFQPTRKLKILNISHNIDDSDAKTPFERVDILIQKLVYSGKSEYQLCQEMAMEINNVGYDGFLSSSYFGQAHKQKLYNINLFGYPVEEGKIKLLSTNRVKLASLSYEYHFGPTNDTHYPLEQDDIKEVMDEIEKMIKKRDISGHDKLVSLYAKFQELLKRKSDKPI